MKITVQILGGDLTVLELDDGDTVGTVKDTLEVANYTATVNGEPAEDDFELAEYEFVTLSPQIKGGC